MTLERGKPDAIPANGESGTLIRTTGSVPVTGEEREILQRHTDLIEPLSRITGTSLHFSGYRVYQDPARLLP
jgi:hypothetical protein